MSQPKHPKDSDALSLKPSASAGTGSGSGKPDFSNVSAKADTKPASGSGGGGSGGPADFSNVKSSVSTVAGDATPSASGKTHTVKSGDTLSAIAQKHYGKASRWRAIFDANRDQIDNPDLIHPGQVLKIPAQDPNDA